MLTRDEQRLLISMLDTVITRDSNQVYDSEAFYLKMSKLRNHKLVVSKKSKDDLRVVEFSLTLRGEVLARILSGLKVNMRGGI